MTQQQIDALTRGLSVQQRARLATRLIESLDELSEAELQSLWIAEAQRRDRLIDAGCLKTRRADEVFKALRVRA
jgi:hypothetical protein